MVPKLNLAMLVLLTAGFTAPLLAQTTEVLPGFNGSYSAYTTNPDGSTSESDILPGFNGSYSIYTTSADGSTSESNVLRGFNGAYSIDTHSEPSFDYAAQSRADDESERALAESDRARAESLRAEERESDESLNEMVREDAAETREMYQAPRYTASEPAPSSYSAPPEVDYSLPSPSAYPQDYDSRRTVRRHANTQIALAKQSCPSKAAVDAWMKANERLLAREARQCNASPLACDLRSMPPLTCNQKTLQRAHRPAVAIPSHDAAIAASIDAYTRKMLAEEKKCDCVR